MLIDRNAFDTARATSLEDLRAACMGCTDCKGPCLTLMQLNLLPDLVLGRTEDRP